MAAEGWSGGHGGSGRGRGKRRTKDGSGGGGNEGVGGSVHTLGIEVREGTGLRGGGERTREQEKGRRGWVIYFPPARHNLSRGFSREHAESTAIEEELGRRERREESSKREGRDRGRVEKGWSAGGGGGAGARAAAAATRSGHQETDVNGGKSIPSYECSFSCPRL